MAVTPANKIVRGGDLQTVGTEIKSAIADKQDTIADLSAIRSGAALGSTSVQPADIENMVEAEPIGSIIPPVNPSEFATKEELSQLGQEVDGFSARKNYPGFLDSSNTIVSYGYAQYKVIEVAGGENFKLSSASNIGVFVLSSFSYNPTLPYTPSFATGETGRRISTSHDFTLPADARYILIQSVNNAGTIFVFSSIFLNGIDILNSLPEQIKDVREKYTTQEDLAGLVTEEEFQQLNAQVNGKDNPVYVELDNTGTITFDPIVLSQDGDELLIEASPSSSVNSQQNGGYPFTFGSPDTKIRIGHYNNGMCLRSDDDTFVFGPAQALTNHRFKIVYANGSTYLKNADTDDTIATYNGQKTVTICGIGSQGMTSYGKWSGSVNTFQYTHNGVSTPLFGLPGFAANDGVTIYHEHEDGLAEKVDKKKIIVFATTNKVSVHFRLNAKYFGMLEINHIVNHNDSVYSDLWGIENQGGQIGDIETLSGNTFTGLGKKLLVGAENEFAIQFYTADFTGGYHGDERIDIENGCYVVFIVDGKEYTISELVALGTISCDSFGYRQKSALYTMYSVTGTHEVIAYHTKRTEFKDGGFVTDNYVEMVQAMTALVTYAGLVCVHKDIADFAINNAGTIFQATHPATATVISDFSNKTNRKVKMYKGGASCELESRVVGGNVASYNTAPINIKIWDRDNDLKYYNMLPTNVSLPANAVFEFEASVVFDYRED